METINGISLQRYAELISKTTDTVTEEEFWQAIENEGVTRDEWVPVKDGWNAKIFAPENYMTIAQDYNNFLEQAITEKNGGGAPCSMEKFADLNAQLQYRKDPADSEKSMDFMDILKENGLAPLKWTEYSGYWAPKVYKEEHQDKYYSLLTQYAQKYQ
jgi:hypothetical protein